MGYVFLAIALFSGITKAACGKSVSGAVKSAKGTFYISLIRMLLCGAVGFFIVLAEGSALPSDPSCLLVSLVSGVTMALFAVTWIFSVRRGAYLMVDVFLMLGVGVTVLLCKIFFDEPITLPQGIGFALLVLASVIMCSYSKSVKGSFTPKNLLLLIACGIFSGLSEFSQKWFVYENTGASVATFNLYTYIFSALVLLIFFSVINKLEKAENDGKSLKVLFRVFIMAVCLFSNSYFKTMAARTIPSAVMYPLSSGADLILSALMASLLFKEKITLKCAIGMVITFVALIVMNL